MTKSRPLRGGLVFGERIGTLVECIVEPDPTVWTGGQIDKFLMFPIKGRVYEISGNVLLPSHVTFSYTRGIMLRTIQNRRVRIAPLMKCEPFFPCECFNLVRRP